jgi:hypothetical protein
LEAENELLKVDIESLRKKLGEANNPTAAKDANLDLSLRELGTQRFDDNKFRAKQRLDRKEIRVTGKLDVIRDRSILLFDNTAGLNPLTVQVQLDDDFLKQSAETMGALQPGMELTAQGRFLFDKMWLENAALVDRKTGKPLTIKDVANLPGAEEKPAEPVPTVPAATKAE